MKNTLLILLSLIMIVSCSNPEDVVLESNLVEDLLEKDGLAYELLSSLPSYDIVGESPVKRDGLYYEYLSPNLANGQYKTHYENGQLEGTESFVDGIPDGLFEYYYPTGQLFKTGTFKDGLREGLVEWYYMDGQLYHRSTFKDGKLEGLYVSYELDETMDATLIEKCFYVNGEKQECEVDF